MNLYGVQVVWHTGSMSDPFLNRVDEIEALERVWRNPGASLVLVWGRRRTGKTRLLGRFVGGKRAVFYGATEQSSEAELRGFAQAARESLRPAGGDLLALADFPSWDGAFTYLGEAARRERLVVVLDEFPYLVEAEPALPSIIQRFWDRAGSETKLRLVLCGSAQAVMENLQNQKAPLFGRVDLRLQLRPFGHKDAALFLPGLPPSERAIAHSVVGGMPTYLKRWRDDVGHGANLRRLFGDATSPLIEEGEFVLSSELPEGAGYFRILLAIANGHRTYGGIRTFADIDIDRQLDRLIRIGLVERVVPATEDPARTRRAMYRIADNFLAFWFRFVYRRRADIARGLGRQVVDRTILPGLSDYMGEPWEEIGREHLRQLAARDALRGPVSSIGRWWNTDHSVEIDVVGVQGRAVVLAGSVKWARKVGRGELSRLRRALDALPNCSRDVHLVLMAREGVEGVDPSEATIITAPDLYEG